MFESNRLAGSAKPFGIDDEDVPGSVQHLVCVVVLELPARQRHAVGGSRVHAADEGQRASRLVEDRLRRRRAQRRTVLIVKRDARVREDDAAFPFGPLLSARSAVDRIRRGCRAAAREREPAFRRTLPGNM